MSPWWTKLELLFWYFIFKSSHCESFEDRVPVDEISSDLTMMRGHQNSSTDNDHQSTYRIFTTKFLLCDCTLSTRYHSICCYLFCVTFSEKCPVYNPLKHVYEFFVLQPPFTNTDTGGNRTKLPSSRWRRHDRSLREVFACSCFFATTDLSQIYNRETRRHGTPCTKSTDSYLFSFLYNNPRKIRRETTVGKFVPNNGRR